jgi:enoyl-CoA hydratase/carnithine racemase
MIAWQQNEGFWELSLGEPPCNEIGLAMLEGLERFLDVVEAAPPAPVVLHSTLTKGFCAGADLRGLYSAVRGRDPASYLPELSRFLDRIHGVMNRLDMLQAPTVAALHGVCFGGGFELALACDVLIAERSTRFCFPELRLGIIPGFGGIPRLNRALPGAVARDLLLTGRSLNATRAHALGLVSQVVGAGEGLAVARDAARQMLRFEPRAASAAKRFLKALPVEELEREKRTFLELFTSPVVTEALRAFCESVDPMPYLPAARGASS